MTRAGGPESVDDVMKSLGWTKNECSCVRTFSGKNQYTNPVGCPIHWKEPTL